nr:IS110 family transposase [Streptomyces alboniger]
MGTLLGVEFIAATGGDLEAFGTADRLASFVGLSPMPRDSGRVSGNMRRPRLYHRGLLRAFRLSAMVSLRTCSASQAYGEVYRWLGLEPVRWIGRARTCLLEPLV